MDLRRYSAIENLRDGRTVMIRALLPADREALALKVFAKSGPAAHSERERDSTHLTLALCR